MADSKVIRLRDVVSGAVVSTSEENAARLSGFEPVEKQAAKRSSSKSDSK